MLIVVVLYIVFYTLLINKYATITSESFSSTYNNVFSPRRLVNWYNDHTNESVLVTIDANGDYTCTESSADNYKYLLTLMSRMKEKYPKLPACTFVHFLGDRDITHDLPVFHNSTINYVTGIVSPLWFYVVKSQLENLTENFNNNSLSWNKKIPKAVWRGSTTGDFNSFRIGYRISRRYVVDCSAEHPDIIDAKFTNFTINNNKYEKHPHMSLAEQCKYRYIISMDGNGGTYGLYWTLMSGSCCLNNSQYRQWFSPYFKDGEHYVSFDDSSDKSNLQFVVSHLNSDPIIPERIAQNSMNVAKKVLNEDFALKYMFELLSNYSKQQLSPSVSSIDVVTPHLKYE